MTVTAEQVQAGQAVLHQANACHLRFRRLDRLEPIVWRCPTPRLVRHYNKYVSANHLDLGVGTGYFLDRCRFPSRQPRLALMDLNLNALEFAAQRVDRYQPETYVRNVLEPIAFEGRKFDSVGINYVLHCLPGSVESKSVALDHLASLMNEGGTLFGSTLLHDGVRRNRLATRLMEYYNSQGIFSNRDDDLAGLTAALHKRFRDVTVKVVGCAALFSGRC